MGQRHHYIVRVKLCKMLDLQHNKVNNMIKAKNIKVLEHAENILCFPSLLLSYKLYNYVILP